MESPVAIFNGARVTLYSQWGRFALQLAGFVVLARLLPPSDFGLVAMVATVVTIATVFSDFGLSLAGIQAKTLDQSQKSNLFWLNVLAGVIATSVVAAAAPLLAAFYGEPRVIPLTILISSSLLIGASYVQFRVELTRKRRFGALAAQDFVSALVGLGGAVAGASLGIGYWALALQPVLQSLCVLVMAVGQAHWWPGLPNTRGAVRRLLVFGGHNLLLQSVNLVSRTVDAMVIGRESGAEALGQYSRGNQLVSLAIVQVVSPLTRIVMPWLARADAEPTFVRSLVQIQRLIGYAVLAILSLVGAVAPAAIIVVLGPNWGSMIALVQILCVGAVFQALGYIYYWALLARARTGLLVLSELPGRVVMVVGSIAVAPFGPFWVATAIALGQVVIFLTSTAIIKRIGVPPLALIRAVATPGVIYLAATASAAGAVNLLGATIVSLLAGIAVWAAVCLVALAIPWVRTDVRSVIASARGRN